MTAVEQIPDIAATPAWDALRKHHDQIGKTHLRQFFDDDPDRGREFTVPSATFTSTTANTASPARRCSC